MHSDPRSHVMRWDGCLRGILLLLSVPVLMAASIHGQVIRVPSQQPTIQKALTTAGVGTTILVETGTYRENLVWPGVDGIRLIALEGPLRTILQASGSKPAVDFPPGLSRATLLEGFAIEAAPGGTGPGVKIASSPTVRFNEISNFRSAVRGGGMVITGGGRPLIDRNSIHRNESQVSGAGIFVDGGASPVLRGNLILGNVLPSRTTSFPATGAGLHVFTSAGTGILISSNVIAGNVIPHAWMNNGGGMALEGGSADVVNNTIVGNHLFGAFPNQSHGGGIYLGKTAVASNFRLFNNIVYANWGSGIESEAPGAPPVIDFNSVWNNRGGDYIKVVRGLNDLWGDPGLAGPTDFHLSPYSPLIDAGTNQAAGQQTTSTSTVIHALWTARCWAGRPCRTSAPTSSTRVSCMYTA